VPCPICGGRDRFQFSDKHVGLWHCRGCGEGGDGIRLVERVLGLEFHEAAKRIEGVIGGGPAMWAPRTVHNLREAPTRVESSTNKPLQPWREAASSIRSTAGERYLATRGLALTDTEAASLRLHPHLWHWPTKTWWPTLVALVALHDGTALASHLTFLARDGLAKAPIERPKLFPAGAHVVGGGVWFGRPNSEHELVVAEGIESTLSAMRLCGAAAGCAALSAVGISKLTLPPEARRVRIYADNDADQKGVLASCEARRRWQAEGRTVAIEVAREAGKDANDVWQGKMTRG
jgi:putative DNA primase/helicase